MNEKIVEKETECLPAMAWVFMAVAVVPHLLAQVGLDVLAKAAALICFPLSMGPFALAHGTILINRLGFTTHMAYISALLFALIWFAIFCSIWRRNRTVTTAVCAVCFLFSATWIWWRIAVPV